MSRLFTSGFESGAMETEALTSGGVTPLGISNSTKRTGGFAAFASASAQTCYSYAPITTVTGRSYYWRFYVNFASAQSAAISLGGIGQVGLRFAWVNLNTNNTVSLITSGTTIGSASAALSPGAWHRIELRCKINTAANDELELLVNGVQVAVNNNFDISASLITMAWLGWQTAYTSTGNIYYDDVALNDDQGSVNNSWPGNGQVVLLKPVADNAVGTGWTLGQTGAMGGNGFASVDNTPPTAIADNTSGANATQIRNATSNANTAYDAQCTDYTTAGIGASDTINAVQPVVVTAAPVTTSAKTGTMGIVSNPAQTIAAWSTDSGQFWSGVAAGTFPTGWEARLGTISQAPSVTLGTRPVLRVNQVTSSTRIAMVCFMGIMVDYTPGAVSNAKTETLTDTFDTSIDSAKWNAFGVTAPAISSGQLQITSAAAGTDYAGVESQANFDLTNSYIMGKITPGLRSGAHEYFFELIKDADVTNKLSWYSSGTTFAARIKTAGVDNDTTLTYSSSSHQWWRIREGTGAGAGGTAGTVYWDTSPDGVTWTNQKTATSPAWITNCYVNIVAGHYAAEASNTVELVDMFNVTPTYHSAAASLSAAGTETAAGQIYQLGVCTQSGASNLTVGGTVVQGGVVSMSATSSLSAYKSDTTYSQALQAASGLVSWWRLNEASGNFLDSKDTNPATSVVGGVTRQAAGLLASDSDTAVSSDGTSGTYIRVPSAANMEVGAQLTVECWVKINTYVSGKDIVGRHSFVTTWFLAETSNTGFRWYVRDANTVDTIIDTSNTIVAGSRQHVVGVYDAAGTMRLYVNGIAVGKPDRTPNANVLNATSIGGQALDMLGQGGVASTSIDGTLDEVALYNTAMDQATVLAHYNIGRIALAASSQSAASNLTVAGIQVDVSASSLSAASNLTVAGTTYVGTVTQLGAASLSASGTQTVAGFVTEYGASSLSATSTLTVAGFVTEYGVETISATSTLTVAGTIVKVAASSQSAASNLTVAGTIYQVGVASQSGTSNLTVAGRVTEIGASSQSATGTLTVAGTLVVIGASSESGTSNLTTTGFLNLGGAASLSATSNLTVAGFVQQYAAVSLSATSSLTATGYLKLGGSVSISGTSNLLIDVTGAIIGSASLSAASSLTVSAVLSARGVVALSAASNLATAGFQTYYGATSLSGTATLTASAFRSVVGGTISFSATSNLAIDTAGQVTAAASLSGASNLTTTPRLTLGGTSTLSGASNLTASGRFMVIGASALSGTSTLTAATVLRATGEIALSSSSILVVDGVPIRYGGVSLDATSDLTAIFFTGLPTRWLTGELVVRPLCHTHHALKPSVHSHGLLKPSIHTHAAVLIGKEPT